MSQQRLMQECFEQSYSQEWEKAGDHDRSVWEAAWWASRAVLEKEAKAAPVGERDDDRAAIHQLAFELGGTEGGEYLLDLDDLNAVIDAAYQRQQARKVVAPDAEGSAAQKSFWAGFESASLRLFGTNIRAAWNSYKASDEFARLNGKEAV